MGKVRKKVGNRKPRLSVGRPPLRYTIAGDLKYKTFAQVQHEAGTAHSMRAAGLTGKWKEYKKMLHQRGLHLFDLNTAKGCLPAKFPEERALACTPKQWHEHAAADGDWLKEHLWVSGKDSKVNKRGFVHLGHRYFRGELRTMNHPQLLLWVMFWRHPLLKIIYSFGLGVRAKAGVELEDGEQRVLAYGLPDSDDAERYKGLTVDLYDGVPRSTFGPFALFNGACKKHANCGIFKLKKKDACFPAWLDPKCCLAAIILVKPVAAGEELLVDYKLDDDDACPLCSA